MNDELIDRSPKTPRDCFIHLLSTVGLGEALQVCDSPMESIDFDQIDKEEDLVALYRLACHAGYPEMREWIFSLDEDTLDYIERQHT